MSRLKNNMQYISTVDAKSDCLIAAFNEAINGILFFQITI